MKEFRLNIQDSKDIIIQVPNDLEIEREEAYAVALVKLQQIIADGIYPINQRVWPCIFCDHCFLNQAKLVSHVRDEKHLKKAAAVERIAAKHMMAREEFPTLKPATKADEPPAPEPTRTRHFACRTCGKPYKHLRARRKHEATHVPLTVEVA